MVHFPATSSYGLHNTPTHTARPWRRTAVGSHRAMRPSPASLNIVSASSLTREGREPTCLEAKDIGQIVTLQALLAGWEKHRPKHLSRGPRRKPHKTLALGCEKFLFYVHVDDMRKPRHVQLRCEKKRGTALEPQLR